MLHFSFVSNVILKVLLMLSNDGMHWYMKTYLSLYNMNNGFHFWWLHWAPWKFSDKNDLYVVYASTDVSQNSLHMYIFESYLNGNIARLYSILNQTIMYVFSKQQNTMSFRHQLTPYIENTGKPNVPTTVAPTKSDSDFIFCLQLLSKTLTCTLHLR